MSTATTRWQTDDSWQEKGTCTKVRTAGATTKDMKELCSYCPVKQECLEYALADPSTKGVWGGTGERDRDKIRKQRQDARSGSAAKARDAAPSSPRAMALVARNVRICDLVAKGAGPGAVAKQYGLSLRTIKRVMAVQTHQDPDNTTTTT